MPFSFNSYIWFCAGFVLQYFLVLSVLFVTPNGAQNFLNGQISIRRPQCPMNIFSPYTVTSCDYCDALPNE